MADLGKCCTVFARDALRIVAEAFDAALSATCGIAE
jgi:hypothetical protein